MEAVFRALTRAVSSLVHPVILLILLVPMVVAAAVWIGVAWAYWDTWSVGIQSVLVHYTADSWIARWNLNDAAGMLAVVVIVILLMPAIIITALLIAAVFAMPVLVSLVARRNYPQLQRLSGGTVLGSAWNALVGIGLFLVLWVITIPLWLLGPIAAVLPLLLSAYLNQRLFRYDALSEHASREEMQQIFAEARGKLFLLGLITGVLYFMPPFNLIGPVFAALAFVHLCLDELARLRAGGAIVRSEG
ncbi:MAG TPA: EI24 domain-containing protein [Burkholderiales bacterium]|nr:EI24 domain-containing protein [Burkholderiales bacterium]